MNAGWYSDPTMPSQHRYWDGAAWTEHVAPAFAPTAALAVPQTSAMIATVGAIQPQPGYVVAPKNPAVSLIVSFFIPGVGSMMNGQAGKGVLILLGWIFSLFLIVVVIGIFGAFGFWLWGMIDAYTGAQRWNRMHGVIS